jgi:hypothetical protein
MSIPQLSSNDIDFKNTVSPLWSALEAVHAKPKYNIPKTFQNCQWNRITSQNAKSSSQAIFPLYNVNPTALLEDCMHVNATIRATIRATAPNTAEPANKYILADGLVAPNAFPFNKAVGTSQIDLGGSNPIVTAVQNFFPQALLFANDAFDYATYYSDCAGQPEVGPYPVVGGINEGLNGSSRNALGKYFGGNLGAEGRFGQVIVKNFTNPRLGPGDAGVATLTFQTFEPLFARCLTMNPRNTKCFIGCSNTSTVNISFTNFSNRVISFPKQIGWEANNISCSAEFTETPQLYYNTYTLPTNTPIPEYSLYHMYGYNNNVASMATGTGGADAINLPVVSFQDSLINRAIYLWVSANEQPSNSKIYQSDYSGYEIETISIQYAGQQSQFSGMDKFQLYDMFHKRQGGIRKFCEFSNSAIIGNGGDSTDALLKAFVGGGSVLRIPAEFITGYDQALYAVGSQISQNLQVTATARWNGLPGDRPPNVYFNVQCVDDSILAISNGMTQELAPAIFITPDVIKRVKESPVYLTGEELDHVGGSFLNDLIKGVKSVGSVVEKIAPLAEVAGAGKKRKGGSLVSQNELQNKLRNL